MNNRSRRNMGISALNLNALGVRPKTYSPPGTPVGTSDLGDAPGADGFDTSDSGLGSLGSFDLPPDAYSSEVVDRWAADPATEAPPASDPFSLRDAVRGPQVGLKIDPDKMLTLDTPTSVENVVAVQVLETKAYDGGQYAIACVRFTDTGECWLYAFASQTGELFQGDPSAGDVIASAKSVYAGNVGVIGEQTPSQWFKHLLQQPTEYGTVGVPNAACVIPVDAPVLFGQNVQIPSDDNGETAPNGGETAPNGGETASNGTGTALKVAVAALGAWFLMRETL